MSMLILILIHNRIVFQICRLLYELMATENSNPEDAIVSLDIMFYFLKGARSYRAIEDFVADGELQMKVGDIFQAENENLHPRRGGGAYLRGANLRTGQNGLLVPKYNLEVIVEPLDFDI